MKYYYPDLIFQQSLSKNEITALLKHINKNDNKEYARNLVSKFNARLRKTNGIELSLKHHQLAYNYLIKNYLNKKNQVKKDTPFNTPDLENILKQADKIVLVEFYFAGTPFKDFYTPLYEVSNYSGNSFKYLVFNNEVQIYNI